MAASCVRVLGIGIALFSGFNRHAAPTASAPSGIDGQTRLDLIHLLDFSLNQTALVMLNRDSPSIELASSPEVTDRFGDDEHSVEAQQSRQWYVGFVSQELAGNFNRRQIFWQ